MMFLLCNTMITDILCYFTIFHNRFWKLEDDGVYLITLNTAQHPTFPCTVSSSWSSKPSGIHMNINGNGNGDGNLNLNVKKEKREDNNNSDVSSFSPPPSPSPSPSPTHPQLNSYSVNKDITNQSPSTIKHVTADTVDSRSGSSSSYVPPSINAVITISPRKGKIIL